MASQHFAEFATKGSLFMVVLTHILVLLIVRQRIGGSGHSSIITKGEQQMKRQDAVHFIPMENPGFMSAIEEQSQPGEAQHTVFPSASSQGKILCVTGRDRSNETANGYGFTEPENLPSNSTLFTGLTFISGQYYDYNNPWHSLNALFVAVSWRLEGACRSPRRLLLYKRGRLVHPMGSWIQFILSKSLDMEIVPEKLMETDTGPVCFQRAVVYKEGFGNMSFNKRNKVINTIKCKLRKFCKVPDPLRTSDSQVNITLLSRAGARSLARSFKNESAVSSAIKTVCQSFQGCHFQLVQSSNLTLCEQVRTLSETDILVSVHGAQMTNMVFMSEGGSIMEMYPKGWLEGAGPGQYAFKWLAAWTGLVHEGAYRDTDGPDCPNPKDVAACFTFHKDGQVGHNETFLKNWTHTVVTNFLKRSALNESRSVARTSCPCD